MVRRLACVLLLVYLLSSVVSVAAWSDPEPDPIAEFLTWGQFLLWMSSSGGVSVAVGILLSVGVEYVPVFGG